MSAERRNVPAVVETAAPVKASSLRSTLAVPAVIADAGDHAARRFLEFFAANKAVEWVLHPALETHPDYHLAKRLLPRGAGSIVSFGIKGGRAEPVELKPEEERLALRAAAAVGAPVAGIDLLPGPRGEWYVLEVNAVPGWRALAPAL